MTAFIAHPSVRIKGSEHAYNPVLCQEEDCSGKDKGTHMHCPLCTVTEAYQDPVILRAHFRVKHVDKGIDFSGLKVLRCCNHCEIVGTIKGEKRFKGAHWHCYRCRNGFNRRDETIKHFKTHFRNPHTTFQIQITQEVNCRQYYDHGAEAHPKAYAGPAVCADLEAESGAVTAILTQPILDTSDTENLHTVEPKDSSTNNGFLITSEEDVDTSHHSLDKTQTLVLMDPDGQAGSLIYEEADNIIAEQCAPHKRRMAFDFYALKKRCCIERAGFYKKQDRNDLEQTVLLEQQVLELQQQNEALQLEKLVMENRLKTEIQKLQEQVSSMVQTNLKLSEELNQYRSVENCNKRVKQLVKSLEEQHRILLQTQLATLSRELLYQAGAAPLNGHVEAEELIVSLDNVAAKGPDDINIVEVQSLEPAPEDVEAWQEKHNPGMDSENSAVVVQSTTVPFLVKENLSSRKRRPNDEVGQDEQTKLQRF